MHSHVPARSWARPIYLAMAMLAPIAVLTFLTPITDAHAQVDRRICRYIWNQSVGNPDRRYVSFVVDYKKKGKCPAIDHHKIELPAAVGGWMPPEDTWERSPEPKMTCEEFQILLSLPNGGDGGDPCTYMADGMLYAVVSHLDGDQGWTRRFWDLGYVDRLAP